MFPILAVTVVMLIVHEAAHAVVTHRLGGQFQGLEFHGPLMVGVKLRVDGLSRTALAGTLLAGPASEVIVLGLAMVLDPQRWPWWVALLVIQWLGNLVPWGLVPNDGTRVWRLWRWGAANRRAESPDTMLDLTTGGPG